MKMNIPNKFRRKFHHGNLILVVILLAGLSVKGQDEGEDSSTLEPGSECPAGCVDQINAAMESIAALEQMLIELNNTVQEKLLAEMPSSDLTGLNLRLNDVETYLYGNVTTTTSKLQTDLDSTSVYCTQQVADVQKRVDDQLANLGSSGGGGSTDSAQILFTNVSTRLDSLEFIKVQTLIAENNVWRQNFEVVKKTFGKMRKSKYGNALILAS